MLYELFIWLDELDVPGAGLFQFISFRAAAAVITALIFSTLIGKRIINALQKKQVGEIVRDLDLAGQMQKQGTPTMGGIIILASILVPTLLFARLDNIYVIVLLITTVWLGAIGFIDDYIKVFKKDKKGLAGKFKIAGQVGLGIMVSLVMFFHPDIVIGEKVATSGGPSVITQTNAASAFGEDDEFHYIEKKSTSTTIPFVKNNDFNYEVLVSWLGPDGKRWTWLAFSIIIIFIITAVSNGANITDGLDGLATGSSAIIGVSLGVLAYVSNHYNISDYLNIMYLPNTAELSVFIAAFIGATVGFLWFNSYPAQVFMGDTGSLALGGILAVFAVMIRKEFLIPILAGVFLMENVSVMLQVGWFKYTKKRTGVGRRVFLMAPIHHHYQKKGYPEPKIVIRFWIIGMILAVLAIVTLKIR